LRGSQVHIPEFKALGIKVPDILAEDYSQSFIPFCYQIQNKIEGQDLGLVIESLSQSHLMNLADEIAVIFKKVKTFAQNDFLFNFTEESPSVKLF
jgi:hypothetical protein